MARGIPECWNVPVLPTDVIKNSSDGKYTQAGGSLVRLLHWMNYRRGFTGHLDCGFNRWRGDPLKDLEPSHGGSAFLPPGDAWIVYPGDRCLLDSIRHEAMRDGVEDYELLRLLAEKDPGKAESLAKTVVPSFTDYARDAKTLRQVRLELLEMLD